jgi:IS5 family transposase
VLGRVGSYCLKRRRIAFPKLSLPVLRHRSFRNHSVQLLAAQVTTVQTQKGNEWYLGMKALVGVDSQTKFVHMAVATAATWRARQCCRGCCTAKGRTSEVTKRIGGRVR